MRSFYGVSARADLHDWRGEHQQAKALYDFSGAPTKGARLREVGEAGRRVGLLNNDVVVAVDGIRVEGYWQYRVARNSRDARDLTLIVSRDGRYREVAAPFRYGWPVSNVVDYVP